MALTDETPCVVQAVGVGRIADGEFSPRENVLIGGEHDAVPVAVVDVLDVVARFAGVIESCC